MKTGTKIALLLAGIAVVGVSGYLIYKSVKKSRDKNQNNSVQKDTAKTETIIKDSLSKPLAQLIPNTQPTGFGAQSGGFSNPNLINRSSSSIYRPLNLNSPNKI
jgi:hypothetical protein